MARSNVLRIMTFIKLGTFTYDSLVLIVGIKEIVFSENPGSRHGGADTVHQEAVASKT
jgi:hypothetical protein